MLFGSVILCCQEHTHMTGAFNIIQMHYLQDIKSEQQSRRVQIHRYQSGNELLSRLQIFVVSFIATCTELFSNYKYNDNILIPLATCSTIYIFKIIG